MKPLRDLWELLRRVKRPMLAIVAMVVIGAAVGGWVLLPVRAQQPQAIPIQVNGETIWLEPGKNVHPQTYKFLLAGPGPGWYESVYWVYVDDMWVPLARGIPVPRSKASPDKAAPSRPTPTIGELGPQFVPECKVTLDVTPFAQCSPPWQDFHLFNDSNCATLCAEGCAITSVAMVFKYFGANTNPGILNNCSAAKGTCSDGTPCCIVWWNAAEYCSDNRAQLNGIWAFNPTDLCSMLRLGRPPIVEVRTARNNQHFVVVYAGEGYDPSSPSDYRIIDPSDATSYKRLSYYSTFLTTIEYRAR